MVLTQSQEELIRKSNDVSTSLFKPIKTKLI